MAQEAGTAPEAHVAVAPVVLDGVVLFRVRGASSLPAATRARLIGDRIAEVAVDRTIEPGTLRVVESEGVSRIVARGVPVVTLVDADAALEGLHRAELTSAYEGDAPEPKVVARKDWFAAPAGTIPADTAPAGTARLQPSRAAATGQPTPHS